MGTAGQENQVKVRLGNLVITRKGTCNRIEVMPTQNAVSGLTAFFCTNCGRSLEVTTGANGFRHYDSFAALDNAVAQAAAK